MQISRRAFLNFCKNSAAAIGLGAVNLAQLEKALANPTGPTVVWLQGSSCTGCSVSFLNRISASAPMTAADVLIQTINLAYHPNLMAVAGDSAASQLQSIRSAGGYILAVEGGVATAFGGAACWAYSIDGVDVTFYDAVRNLAAGASRIISVGTCASWGGVPAAGPNPTGVRGVQAATGLPTLNIPGCPPHPDWIVWAIANLLTGTVGSVDSYSRPAALYGKSVHGQCPRRGQSQATTYGQDQLCMKGLGCFGPRTNANCPVIRWNGGQNWCVDANSQCIGCTSPTFPGTASLRRRPDGK
jgi:hydrogenase small subunit